MPDKQRERWYLEQLRQTVDDFPEGAIDLGESPDVIVSSSSKRVGIEITAFHLPPPPGERPHQERQSLKRRVVQQAFELHTQAGAPALYVKVHFGDVRVLRKETVRELAKALAAAVQRAQVPLSLADGWILLPYSELPETIVSVRIAASVDGNDRLWSADDGGWLAPVLPHHIEEVIAAKRTMFETARRRCDEVWLAIVNDAFIGAAQAELSDDAASHAYSHPFARLLWLEPHRPALKALAAVVPEGGRG